MSTLGKPAVPFPSLSCLPPRHHQPRSIAMYNIFYLIGVIVVILAVLSLVGLA